MWLSVLDQMLDSLSDPTESGDLGMDTHIYTFWPSGAEWSLNKLIRKGDAYGFRG